MVRGRSAIGRCWECAGSRLFTLCCFPYIIGKGCLGSSPTPRGKLHTVTNCAVIAAAVATCFMFWVGSSLTARMAAGANLQLDTQFTTTASCPWDEESSEGCLVCSQMEGPPSPTAGCGMTCDAAWIRFADTSNTTEVRLSPRQRGAVASVEDLDLITVSVHEANSKGVGFVSKLQLCFGGTPIFEWNGEDSTNCGGVLHASNFTLAEGVTLDEPLFFDQILMAVSKPGPRVPALVSAVSVTSKLGVVKASVAQQALYAVLFVATPIFAMLYFSVVSEACLFPLRSLYIISQLDQEALDVGKVAISCVLFVFGVFVFFIWDTWPSDLNAAELWSQLRYRWFGWGFMVCAFLVSIAGGLALGGCTIQKRRTRWGRSASFVVAHKFVAFDVETHIMAVGGTIAAGAVILLVWTSAVAVALAGISWGWRMDATTMAVWLLWLFQIKGTLQYLAMGEKEGRRHQSVPAGSAAPLLNPATQPCAPVLLIVKPAARETVDQAMSESLTVKRAAMLERALLAWRFKRQCRHGGAMLRRLKAAVLHMKVQAEHHADSLPFPIQVVVDGDVARAAKEDCDVLFGQVAQPARATVQAAGGFSQGTHPLRDLLPLLGRQHVPDRVLARVRAELRNRAYGCGVMVPLAHDYGTSYESKAETVLDALPPLQPISWTKATFYVDGVAPAPLLPLRHARVPVAKGSDEWKRVMRQFGSGEQVKRIDRIQNPLLWQRYRERVRELRLELMHTRRYVAQTPGLMMEGRTRLRSTSLTPADSSCSQPGNTKVCQPAGNGVQPNRAHTARLGTTPNPSIAGWVSPATRYSIQGLPVGHRELVMWHGCSEAAVDSICDSGFQPKMTTRANIGFGTYFAPMSTTAVTYSKQKASSNPSGGKAIIMAVVAAGIDVVGNDSLKLPCYASHPSQRVMWDVTTDCKIGEPPSMMAVFDKRQAYPAYVLYMS